ncbi:MAG: GNAT family N-acetyltransferase, partial [Oligoflexia bacterium]|nr:GNAT family N-acetyltransferase [Oligoflexia bacterium]
WRRQGLGRRLLTGFLATCTAKGATVLWLEVRSDNNAAIQLYSQAGLRPTGRRSDYYTDGIDAILMACPLHAGQHGPVSA